eukprot:scaffold49318_cov33-Tisochrysis_lutea.AAC.1
MSTTRVMVQPAINAEWHLLSILLCRASPGSSALDARTIIVACILVGWHVYAASMSCHAYLSAVLHCSFVHVRICAIIASAGSATWLGAQCIVQMRKTAKSCSRCMAMA